MLLPDELLLRRIKARTLPDNGTGCRCVGGKSMRGGYGRLWNGEALEDTHRISYRVHKGPIPAGFDVLHRCDAPACWEPEHLFLGTQADNNRDRHAKARDGHPPSPHRPSSQRGEKHKRAKLTVEQVRKIRKAKGKIKGTWLAREYGVSTGLIYGIWERKNWGWLD